MKDALNFRHPNAVLQTFKVSVRVTPGITQLLMEVFAEKETQKPSGSSEGASPVKYLIT